MLSKAWSVNLVRDERTTVCSYTVSARVCSAETVHVSKFEQPKLSNIINLQMRPKHTKSGFCLQTWPH